MHCPYHPHQAILVDLPEHLQDGNGWIVWPTGCCGVPVWRCPEGLLHPLEARFCTHHGCERPPAARVLHEVYGASLPGLVHRRLELEPAHDGQSTPALAGNVLIYLTRKGRLVAVDLGGSGATYLADGIEQASLRVERGQVVALLRSAGSVQSMSWDSRDLREAVEDGSSAQAERWSGASTSLLGLPVGGGRLHLGSGLVRLIVEDDPVPPIAQDAYQRVTGVRPGRWLIRRTHNPSAPTIHLPDLRPQRLDQVPVPVQGGVLLIGQLRYRGVSVEGAMVVPNYGVHHVER